MPNFILVIKQNGHMYLQYIVFLKNDHQSFLLYNIIIMDMVTCNNIIRCSLHTVQWKTLWDKPLVNLAIYTMVCIVCFDVLVIIRLIDTRARSLNHLTTQL